MCICTPRGALEYFTPDPAAFIVGPPLTAAKNEHTNTRKFANCKNNSFEFITGGGGFSKLLHTLYINVQCVCVHAVRITY